MLSTDTIETFTGAAVVATTPLSGGDVAQAFKVDLANGATVFAKTHHSPPPGFFTTEATGLAWLRDAAAAGGSHSITPESTEPGALELGAVGVPEVLGCSDDPPLLVLEWIEESGHPPDEHAFGRALAALHQAGALCFGREDRRTTGSRGLPNEPCDTWASFYATQRLLPLARLASDAQALSPDTVTALEHVADSLDDLGGPPEPPARLHGDLWAGNRIVDTTGRSWLIDPACHGGHREFDLAMMRLFGGFSDECHRAYAEVAPLADDWRDRVLLHQLAPLVVHAIKFGGGYVSAATNAIATYR